MVRTDFGGDDVATALAVQGDGRIVAAGGKGSDFALARYTRDGRLDRSFGLGGKVVTHVGPPPVGRVSDWGGARAIAIQPDGKIVVAGGVGSKFALVRYTRRGHLDPSFGAGGTVLTDVGGRSGGPRIEPLGAKAIALQADGKIVAAGTGPAHFALARYTSDGQLDASFGTDGVVVTDVGRADGAEAIAVQPDGRILVAGWSEFDFAVARYLPTGRLDATFGTNGKVVDHPPGGDDYDQAEAVGVEPDQKIVVAGWTGPRFPAAVLLRYTAAGELDPSFGRRGVATGPGAANALAIQRDGRIVVAQGANFVANPCCSSRMEREVVLLRYTQRGRPDRTFGGGGEVVTRPGCARRKTAGVLWVSALAIGTNSQLIVAGGCGREGRRDFLLVRYGPDGHAG